MEDAHLDLWRAETAATEPDGWERWIAKARDIAGHDLDGNEASDADNYSMDSAFAVWKSGSSLAEYVASFQA